MKKKARKITAWLVLIAMMMSLCPGFSVPLMAVDNPYIYIDADGRIKTQENVTAIDSSMTSLTDGWYVVRTDVTIDSRITVSGNVHLILVEGHTLTASNGITVNSGNSLTIYGQTDPGTGELIARGSYGNAGIGGEEDQSAGNITINGGTVTATGGADAAGIGGGNGCDDIGGDGGTITINGGTVTATSGAFSAGIGGGSYGDGGTITINGGNITATSVSGGGAGIGGSSDGGCGTIVINGGTVTATGSSESAAGIGHGYYGEGSDGTITINGGNIKVTSGWLNAGISGTPKNSGGKVLTLATVASPDRVISIGYDLGNVEYYYGVEDMASIDGKLYLYVPSATSNISVNSVDYICNRNGAWYTSHDYVNGVCTGCKEFCTHERTYTASGNIIKENCSVCPAEGLGTATLIAEDMTYCRFPNSATVVYNEGWTGSKVLTVTYEQNGNVLDTAPIAPGTYTASITYEGATASVEFAIEKVKPQIEWEDQTVTYTGQPAAITPPTVIWDGLQITDYEIIYLYKINDGSSDIGLPGLPFNAGSYIIDAIIEEGGYHQSVNAEMNLTITSAIPDVTAPTAKEGLVYSGEEQELVKAGSTTGGTMQYSTEEMGTYSSDIPVGINAGNYTVWYKIVGDGNYADVAPAGVYVSIAPKVVDDVTVEGMNKTYVYTGEDIKPVIVVKDGDAVIPDTEYTVSYEGDTRNIGTVTVRITDKNGGNYTVNGSATYEIIKADAEVTAAPVAKEGLVYNGAAQELILGGTAKGGAMAYSIDGGETYVAEIPQATKAGTYTVFYKVVGDQNHKDTEAASVEVTIAKRSITPVDVYNNTYNIDKPLTKTYNGTDDCGGQLIEFENVVDGDDIYYSSYYRYDSPNVGDQKYIIAYGIQLLERDSYDIDNYALAKTEVTSKQPYGKITKADAGTIDDPTASEITYGQTLAESTLTTENSAYGNFQWVDINVLPTVENSGYKAVLKLSADDLNNYNFEDVKGFDRVSGLIERIVALTVKKADINDFISFDEGREYTYNGNHQAPGLIVADGLEKGVDYDVIYAKVVADENADNGVKTEDVTECVDAGSYMMVVFGMGNYAGSVKDGEQNQRLFTIEKADINDFISFEGDGHSFVYDGKDHSPKIVVDDGLVKDVDYKVVYAETYDDVEAEAMDFIHVGNYMAVVYGMGNYSGFVKDGEENLWKCTIAPKELTPTVTGSVSKVYDGTTAVPAGLSITLNGIITGDDVRATATYAYDNANVGTVKINAADITLSGKDAKNYVLKSTTASAEVGTIEPADINDFISFEGDGHSFVYDGKDHAPKIVVDDGLVKDVDYKVVYAETYDDVEADAMDFIHVGNYMAVVYGMGNYSGFVKDGEENLWKCTIAPKQLHWDASGLSATKYEGDRKEAPVYGELKLVGVINDEVTFTQPADLMTQGFTATKVGTYTVDVVSEANGWVFDYADGCEEDYLIPTELKVDAVVKAVGDCDKGEICPIGQFDDADADAWYHDGVHYALESGLMVGFDDGSFRPSDATTRAQFAMMIWRLEGCPEAASVADFDDLAEGAWYEDAIAWAAEKGIVTGYGNGNFGPDDTITREQMALMMYRYAVYKGYDVSVGENTNMLSYPDALEISEWAMEAMQWAIGSGLMQGHANGTIDAKGYAERAQVATVFYRFCEVIEK